METRNVIAAISMSAAVLVLWSLFMVPEPDPNQIKKEPVKKTKVIESSDTPSLDKNENFTKLTREDALAENDRIQFENNNVIGSISLKGATIDDLTFKEYNVELNGNQKVTLLSPRKVEDGYLVSFSCLTAGSYPPVLNQGLHLAILLIDFAMPLINP